MLIFPIHECDYDAAQNLLDLRNQPLVARDASKMLLDMQTKLRSAYILCNLRKANRQLAITRAAKTGEFHQNRPLDDDETEDDEDPDQGPERILLELKATSKNGEVVMHKPNSIPQAPKQRLHLNPTTPPMPAPPSPATNESSLPGRKQMLRSRCKPKRFT